MSSINFKGFSTDDLRAALESRAKNETNRTISAKQMVENMAKNALTNSNSFPLTKALSKYSSFPRLGSVSATVRDASIKNRANKPAAMFSNPGLAIASSYRSRPEGAQFSEVYQDGFAGRRTPAGFGISPNTPTFSQITERKIARFPSIKRKSMTRLNGFPFLLDENSDYIIPPQQQIYQGTGEFAIPQSYGFGLGGISYLANFDVPYYGYNSRSKTLHQGNTYNPDKDGKKGLGVSMNNYYNLACIETDFIIKTTNVPDEYDHGFCYNPDISSENEDEELQLVSHDFDVVESFTKDHFVAWCRDYPELTGRFLDPAIYANAERGIAEPPEGEIVYKIQSENDFSSFGDIVDYELDSSAGFIDYKDGTFQKPNISVINGIIDLPHDGLVIDEKFKISLDGDDPVSIKSVSALRGTNRNLHVNRIELTDSNISLNDVPYEIYRPVMEALRYEDLNPADQAKIQNHRSEWQQRIGSQNRHGVSLEIIDDETKLIAGTGSKYSSLFWHGKNFGTPMPVDFFAPITIQPENTGAFVITLDSGVANYFESREDFEKAKPFNCNLMFDYSTESIDHEGFSRKIPEYYTSPYKAYIVPAKGWDFEVVGSLVKGIYYEYPFNPEDRILTYASVHRTRGPDNARLTPVYTHPISGKDSSSINYNELPLTHMPFTYGPGKGWGLQPGRGSEILLTPTSSQSEIQNRNGTEGPYDTVLTHGEENKHEFYAPISRPQSVLSDTANSLNNPIYSDNLRQLSSNTEVAGTAFKQSRLHLSAGGVKPPLSEGFVDNSLFPKTSNLLMRSQLRKPLQGSNLQIGADRSIPIKTKDFSEAVQSTSVGGAICGCGGRGRSLGSKPKPGDFKPQGNVSKRISASQLRTPNLTDAFGNRFTAVAVPR